MQWLANRCTAVQMDTKILAADGALGSGHMLYIINTLQACGKSSADYFLLLSICRIMMSAHHNAEACGLGPHQS